MPRILLAILLLLPTACAMPTVYDSDHAAVTGRTWVVTGASSGIGRGVAERAGSMGARVVLAARRADALEEVARTIRAGGGEALVVPTDVSRPEAVSALAEAAERRFGHVDIWFNNAAIAAIGRFEEIPVPDHARIVDVNLNGVIYGSHAALRRFRAQGYGTLVNIASVRGPCH
jgi:NADP-dependent 3-hydroxy acid dehydrogenase YdfG